MILLLRKVDILVVFFTGFGAVFSIIKNLYMNNVALLVRLESKPGKEQEVEDFLRSALPLAQQETLTSTWFALRLGTSSFGIFDSFPGNDARQAHLNGPIAAALMAKSGELLSEPPRIEMVDILAVKVPS
jgi:quinol monooxygenase YgiN